MNNDREIIIESRSPMCGIQAFVEKTKNSYYFYLWYNLMRASSKVKSCWLCNRKKAPKKPDIKAMEKGEAPMMPAEFVKHDKKGMELNADRLSIVWFEEGNGAALLSGEEIIAVIPQWSGMNNFHGYSKYAVGMNTLAWELNDAAAENLAQRVVKGQRLWDKISGGDNAEMWMFLQEKPAKEFVGEVQTEYGIAFQGEAFPPKRVVQGTRNGVNYGVTAGVSLAALPLIEMYVEDNPDDHKRIEFGFAAEEKFSGLCKDMYVNLSSYAAMPWREETFFAHGHTVQMNNIKGFSAVLMVSARFQGLECPEYVNIIDNGKINTLWVVPITQEEYDFTVQNGIDELMKRAKDISRIHIFDGQNKFTV